MKKNGFTLAEVLIALGIIGVVAAMTMPTFTASTANAKIGPALATAVSNFEQANGALIQINDVKGLTKLHGSWKYYTENLEGKGYDGDLFTGEVDADSAYLSALGDYLKGSQEGRTLYTKSGASYTIESEKPEARSEMNANITSNAAHKIFIANAYIDINGKSKPNKMGQDVFAFGLFNDGSLRPVGGHPAWNNKDDAYWDKLCPAAPQEVEDYRYCAGHIFENNMKVLYE